MNRIILIVLWFAVFLLQGCSQVPTPQSRADAVDRLVGGHGWKGYAVDGGLFQLQAYGPATRDPVRHLRVYIEGDGLAWISRSRPSSNPTPITPIGLQLALADPTGQAIYLARPCQYRYGLACAPEYWLARRFSPEVIAATGQAIDRLKQRYHAQSVILVGYSGGAAVAALVAAHRSDVGALITVAGNLDTRLWTQHHSVTPLTGSLNPADYAALLHTIPQWHFTGAKDAIIPPLIAGAFAKHFAEQAPLHILTLQAYDHYCCWADQWPQLLSMTGLTQLLEDY